VGEWYRLTRVVPDKIQRVVKWVCDCVCGWCVAPGAAPLSVSGETVDSHSIRVTWSAPPSDQWNGVLAGYRVLYAEADGGNSDGSVASVPADELSYTVRGLHEWTLYNVWVLAYTAAGDGPRSDVIVVQTAEDGELTDSVCLKYTYSHNAVV